MFQNLIVDPGFEAAALGAPGWEVILDLCDIQGAVLNTNLGNVRTGLKSLRINARRQAIGPTTTCGGVSQIISGITPFVPYMAGVWWKSAGVFPSVVANMIFESTTLVTINGNTGTPWRFAGSAFIPQVSSGVLSIVQGSGTQNSEQQRYFDDAIFGKVEDLGDVTIIQQLLRAGLFDPASLGIVSSASERVTAVVESLAPSGSALAIGLQRGVPSKP